MSPRPLNHKRTTSSLAPPIFYVAKNWQLKDRRFPIGIEFLHNNTKYCHNNLVTGKLYQTQRKLIRIKVITTFEKAVEN